MIRDFFLIVLIIGMFMLVSKWDESQKRGGGLKQVIEEIWYGKSQYETQKPSTP